LNDFGYVNRIFHVIVHLYVAFIVVQSDNRLDQYAPFQKLAPLRSQLARSDPICRQLTDICRQLTDETWAVLGLQDTFSQRGGKRSNGAVGAPVVEKKASSSGRKAQQASTYADNKSKYFIPDCILLFFFCELI
jgi:hypothetical protein